MNLRGTFSVFIMTGLIKHIARRENRMTAEDFARRIVEMQPTLYRVSYSLLRQAHDREDAVQECIRKAWEKRARLRDERTIKAWVTRILINECYNVLRHGQRMVPAEEVPEPPAPPDAHPALHDAVLRLEDRLRVPVVLHYMEGYELSEIAGMLRVPTGTVKTRLMLARKLLRDMLEEEV